MNVLVSVLNPLLLLTLKFSTQAVVYIVWPFSSSPSHSCFDSFSIWNSKSSMFSTRPSSQYIYEHMTIVRVSIVCLIDRWIWISVSSVLHFVCCTFFFLILPLLYLLLVVLIIYPIYYRTCKPCAMNHYPISLVQITLIPI